MKRQRPDCRELCAPGHFERNAYFHGKLLTAHDFQQEQCYFNRKRWLINRMVLGSGVVCGLEVEDRGEEVVVKPGLAIDSCGREILVCEEEVLAEEQLAEMAKKLPAGNGALRICLHYVECRTGPVPLPPIACSEAERTEFNRIQESFDIEIVPEEPPTEEPAQGPDWSWCPLMAAKVPPRPAEDVEQMEKPVEEEPEGYPTWHESLCGQTAAECPGLPERRCVVLGRVLFEEYERIGVELCGERSIVYTNPLLYRLIDCLHGDLPHIVGANWLPPDGEGPMEWVRFSGLMGEGGEGLAIDFDQPIKGRETGDGSGEPPRVLDPTSFQVVILTKDMESEFLEQHRVPGEVFLDDAGLRATFHPTSEWITDTFVASSAIKSLGGVVEVTVLGSRIIGESGRALDADFLDGRFPTGNGVQGGDFHSSFVVEQEEPKAQKAS